MKIAHLLIALVGLLVSAQAADSKAALRLLRDECLGCHKPGKAKGGLLLTTHEKMMQGGDSGLAIVPGKAEQSLLYQLLLPDADPQMPPKKALSSEALAVIRAWIDAGAVWDSTVFDEAPKPRLVKLSGLPETYRPVLSLALSPDNQSLAVARGATVFVFDLSRPERPVKSKLEGHVEAIQSLAWTSDGRYLVSGGFQKLILWDVQLQAPAKILEGTLMGNITAVAATQAHLFAADGEAGGAGFIRKFDLQSGKLMATWKAHEDNVLALRLSSRGDRLLSGGADKLARLWDAESHALMASYEGHTNHVLAVAFNKEATQIATAGADREVKVWDVSSREQDVTLGDKKMVFTGAAWTPDGKSLVIVTDKGSGSVHSELKKHDGAQRSETGKTLKLTSVNESLTSVVITDDSKWIYAGSFEGNVHIWDEGGKPAGVLMWPNEQR